MSQIQEWDFGTEWPFSKSLELVAMYSMTDRTNTTAQGTANTLSYEPFDGSMLMFQVQVNDSIDAAIVQCTQQSVKFIRAEPYGASIQSHGLVTSLACSGCRSSRLHSEQTQVVILQYGTSAESWPWKIVANHPAQGRSFRLQPEFDKVSRMCCPESIVPEVNRQCPNRSMA